MVRWTPGSKDRLQVAAFEAIRARGLEAVTVAEIASAAGVTERTFFRHFADKREVLFSGQQVLLDACVTFIAGADPSVPAGQAAAYALRGVAERMFPDERRASSRVRGEVIAADAGLMERESLKMRALAEAIAEALRARGTDEPEASLVAQTYVGVFTVAFAQWLAPDEERSLAEIQDALLSRLGALITPA